MKMMRDQGYSEEEIQDFIREQEKQGVQRGLSDAPRPQEIPPRADVGQAATGARMALQGHDGGVERTDDDPHYAATPQITRGPRPFVEGGATPPRSGGKKISFAGDDAGLRSGPRRTPEATRLKQQGMGDQQQALDQIEHLLRNPREQVTEPNHAFNLPYVLGEYRRHYGEPPSYILDLMQPAPAPPLTAARERGQGGRGGAPPRPVARVSPDPPAVDEQPIGSLRQLMERIAANQEQAGQGQQTRQRIGAARDQIVPQPLVVPQPTKVVKDTPTTGKPKIEIKQIVKQEINRKNKKRATRVKKKNKESITRARKQYTKEKKSVLQSIRSAHKAHIKTESEKIKKLPQKQRKAARAKLKQTAKDKLTKLTKKIKPGTFYKKIDQLQKAVVAIRKLGW